MDGSFENENRERGDWKKSPHSYKGKIERCVGKNFSEFIRISFLSKWEKLCLCRQTAALKNQIGNEAHTKRPPHTFKGRFGEGYRKKLFAFYQNLCFAQTETSAFVQEDGSAHSRQQNRGIAFRWRCPLSLSNATQFLRWVCLQKSLAIRYE